jgi:hypothetical protein
MGMGDEIMAAGRAETLYQSTRFPVAVTDSKGRVRWSEMWDGNPALDPNSPQKLVDCPGHRAYIERWIGRRVVFRQEHRPRAGKIFLAQGELAWAAQLGLPDEFILVEPTIAPKSSPNKQWGRANWEKLVSLLTLPVYQMGPDDGRITLPGAHRIMTPTARHAAAIVARARLLVLPEGGLHHIAASFGRRAVVIFGAFTPPLVTGYDFHTNIAVETPEGYCGRYEPCSHCAAAMATISPEHVAGLAGVMLAASSTAPREVAHN